MRAEMTSLFIGTNDVTPPSVPSLQFEVLGLTTSEFVIVAKNPVQTREPEFALFSSRESQVDLQVTGLENAFGF